MLHLIKQHNKSKPMPLGRFGPGKEIHSVANKMVTTVYIHPTILENFFASNISLEFIIFFSPFYLVLINV